MSAEFLYLLLIDLCRINAKENYASFSQVEPNYGPSMIKAYLTAFDKNQPKKMMTHDLLKSIHQSAMPGNNNKGEYKTIHNNFEAWLKYQIVGQKRGINVGYSLS